MISNVGQSQCTVNDLPDTVQKKIITKFVQLDECNELRHQDSVYLFDLRTINSDLVQENTKLNIKAVRRKNIAISGIIVSFAGGLWLGIKL